MSAIGKINNNSHSKIRLSGKNRPLLWLLERKIHQDIRHNSKVIVYQYQILPQGVNISPAIFKSITLKITQLWKTLFNVIAVVYLDDFLLWHEDANILRTQIGQTLGDLSLRNFKVNISKSTLSPSKTLEFIGLILDTSRQPLTIPTDKQQAYAAQITRIIRRSHPDLINLKDLRGILQFVNLIRQMPGVCA